MKKLGNLELRQGIIWRDVLAQEKAWQTVKTPIGGTPHIFEGLKRGGEIITLYAGTDKKFFEYFTHDEMMALVQMRDEIGATHLFSWDDIVQDLPVMFYRNGNSINYQTTFGYDQKLSYLQKELYQTELKLIATIPFTIRG